MKQLHKQCKSIEQANQYLKSIGLEDLAFFGEFSGDYKEYDIDTWLDGSETKGASVQITSDFEVSVMKYTDEDIKKLEAELL